MARWTKPGLLSSVMADWRRVGLTVLDVEGARERRAGPSCASLTSSGSAGFLNAASRARRSAFATRSTAFCARPGYSPVTFRGDLRLCCFAVELLVDELVSLMFDEIERVRGPKNGTARRLPAASLAVLERMPSRTPRSSR